ncbi:MAG TPA: peptidyl-prolyl cis-trans isomerase [Nitrospirota bacterium]|nr:peptidyl-prolyl cis-trans isomerase [Nitrospirota bacterium]
MDIRRCSQYIAPLLLVGLLFFSCKKQGTEQQRDNDTSANVKIVATVNGDPITLAEFQERFARAGFKSERDVRLAVKEEFLNRLIERTMMLREAQRKRIKIGLPEINNRIAAFRNEHGKDVKSDLDGLGIDFEKWKSDIWEDLMIERLLSREVYRRSSVSSSEVRRYYLANPREFEKPEQVHVRQIVVSTEEEAKIAQNLLQSGADFEVIAREKSTAPEASSGGDLGYFSMGEMPVDFNVVFGLSKGGVSGIIKSPYGYHLFKLVDKRRAGKISLEEAYKEIEEKLSREKEDNRYKQWLKELRSRTKFEVNYSALE